MTFDVIPWFLHSIYVTILSCDMLSTLFLENIFFLCNRLKPSYVITFDNNSWVFFTFSYAMRNNIDNPPGPPTKAGTTLMNFFDVNISWDWKPCWCLSFAAVDVNILDVNTPPPIKWDLGQFLLKFTNFFGFQFFTNSTSFWKFSIQTEKLYKCKKTQCKDFISEITSCIWQLHSFNLMTFYIWFCSSVFREVFIRHKK